MPLTPLCHTLKRYSALLAALLFACTLPAHLLADELPLPGTGITLVSAEQEGVVSADITTLLHAPFPTVAAALTRAGNWCQFMPLHFNIKGCLYQQQPGNEQLTLFSGRKHYQSTEDSYPLTYTFKVTQLDSRLLALQLQAMDGPAGTKDYRIELTAQQTATGVRLHIHSSYRPSMVSSLLTRSYLSTLGRDKVGFSSRIVDGESQPVQGVRGVIERNIVRYQFAIDAFLATATLPPAQQHDAALRYWFKQNEQYPQQLHEMSEVEYLLAKGKEWENQLQMQQALNERAQLATLQ